MRARAISRTRGALPVAGRQEADLPAAYLPVRHPRTAAAVAVAHGEALIVQPVAVHGVRCHLLPRQRQLAAVAAEDL